MQITTNLRRLRISLAGLLLAAMAAAGAVVPAAQPAAASTTCTFTMLKLHAYNLRSNNGSDYAFLKIDDQWFPGGADGVKFASGGTTKYWNLFGDPHVSFGSTGITIRLVLDLFPANHTVDTGAIGCVETHDAEMTFDDGDALYKLTYSVT